MNDDSQNTRDRLAEAKGQMSLSAGMDYRTANCPECGLLKTKRELETGFWGLCRDCEEERIQDVCAG
jgi:ribosomal protein L37AE/L43A